jgi:hypothetical protein
VRLTAARQLRKLGVARASTELRSRSDRSAQRVYEVQANMKLRTAAACERC